MRVFLVRLNEPDGFDNEIGFMREFVRGEKNKKGQQRGLKSEFGIRAAI
jgi:hypothetical protein